MIKTTSSKTLPAAISDLRRSELPDGLESRVMQRIRAAMRRRIRARLAWFGAGTVAGVGGVAALGSGLLRAFAHSGFYEYVSLLLSGDSAVLRLWKELGMSLLESLPMLSVIGVLAAAAFAVWAGANAFTNARRIGTLAAA